MVIIGCDFHPNGQQVLAIDDQSREVVDARWLNQARDEAEQVLYLIAGRSNGGRGEQSKQLWFERLPSRSGHKRVF